MAIYSLFISHSWAYGDAYDRLVELLDSAPKFSYRDYSVPKDDPIHNRGTDKALCEAIEQKFCLSRVKWLETASNDASPQM